MWFPIITDFSKQFGQKTLPNSPQPAQDGGNIKFNIFQSNLSKRTGRYIFSKEFDLALIFPLEINYLLKIPEFITWKSAGANSTINKDGKMMNAKGINILIGAL